MGHYYDQQGNPAYEVPNKSKPGTSRATTLADAKKLGLVPSVTTVMQCAAKPALDRWKQDQLINAVIESLNTDDAIALDDEWKSTVLRLSQETSKKAAQRGNEIHDRLEKYFKKNTLPKKDSEFTQPVVDLINNMFQGINWVAEESFHCPLGFGGKIDLHCKEHKGIFIDFKTKNTSDINKMQGYDEHCMQLSAYRSGLQLPYAKCYNIFISTEVPGLLSVKEWTEEELNRGYDMFTALLTYWKLLNKVN